MSFRFFLVRVRKLDNRIKKKLGIKRGPLVIEPEPIRTKPPTWPEVLLLAAAGSCSILGGLMMTGVYGFFTVPLPFRNGFLIFLLGGCFFAFFCALVDESPKKPNERPPSQASERGAEGQRREGDREERRPVVLHHSPDNLPDQE